VQDELDSDVDCPPLALASSIEASDNTNTAAESMVAVGSTNNSSGSSSSSSSTGSEQTKHTAASVQDELDSDVDCPPLALASSIEASDNTNTAAESMVAVGSTNNSSGSSSSSSSTGSEQTKQQPCVQCGKLTRKRCKRCQAVYYCSEECQIQCLKDPEHRAACEAAAAAATAAAATAAAVTS
jgi:MYND finger